MRKFAAIELKPRRYFFIIFFSISLRAFFMTLVWLVIKIGTPVAYMRRGKEEKLYDVVFIVRIIHEALEN